MIVHKKNDKLWKPMKSDCSKCSGLCCTALFFSKTDGFPKDKIAGEPCMHLLKNYQCKIHSQLKAKKMRGCIGYDCFGAGNQVTEIVYKRKTWNELPKQSKEIFDVFTAVFQLYQIRYFLTEASLLIFADSFSGDIQKLIEEHVRITNNSPQIILSFNIEEYRSKANDVLKEICKRLHGKENRKDFSCPKDFIGKKFRGKDMSGLDLSTKLLIAADFSDCIFDGTIFLGADTRDTNFTGADLEEAVFLTQGQINAAKGNRSTKIPKHLYYPVTWR